MALLFVIGVWQMGKELRRAVRLWALRRALRLRRQQRATGSTTDDRFAPGQRRGRRQMWDVRW
jgi:hypothetical protein